MRVCFRGIHPAAVPVVLFVALILAGCRPKAQFRSRSTADWQAMAAATENDQSAKSPQIGLLLEKHLAIDEPMWPVDTFLRAELYRLRGDAEDARKSYRALAEWGATDPYKDRWGASGLATIALWRWVESAVSGSSVDEKEVSQMLACAQAVQLTRLSRGMFFDPLLASLPQVEEETVRGLARLAWLAGKKDPAERLFLEYLQLARTQQLDTVENAMWQNLVSSGQASVDRLTLLVATRLSILGQNDAAVPMFRVILRSEDSEVRAQAGYHLARLDRLRGASRPALINTLTGALEDAADPRLSQQILIARAETYNLPGKDRDVAGYEHDLLQLVTEFPNGSLTYSALYELARYYEERGDTETALGYFERLQTLRAGNPRFELSYYEAALALYTRAGPGDCENAEKLLQKYLTSRPDGALRVAALFWLGRLSEDSNRLQKAHDYFSEVIQESPYDYYAVRARMHLNVGLSARSQPSPDRLTLGQLRSAYDSRSEDTNFPEQSPYASRLGEELRSKLYAESLGAAIRLRHMYPSQRLEEVTLLALDSSHLFSRIALLLAFRQDALAAASLHPEGRQRIAVAVGELARDWPLTQRLCCGADASQRGASGFQKDAHFLTAAYPTAFAAAFRNTGDTYELQPELLYSVVREESFFYPAALSPDGALGLFQFIPSTFQTLDRRWELLRSSGISSREEFLLNPARSIDLGGRWFHEYLLPVNGGDIVAALVEHNTNRKLVKAWKSSLTALGRSGDVEYAIETIPYMSTRVFVKGVLGDLAIMRAAASLDSQSRQ